MSLQGSWCDAVIVQAVSESQNVRIHIVESHENFADTTLVEPVHLSQQLPATIYLGHLNEVHYVSTVPYTCSSNSLESQHSDNQLSITEQIFFSEKSHNSPKRKSDSNMNEQSKKMSNENICGLECEAEKQSSRAYKSQNFENKTDKMCVKRNRNAYMREYREKKHKADETSAKTKHNAYMRKYRGKKKVDKSRKGKSNDPSLQRGIEKQSSTSKNAQNTECDIEKQSDDSMVEYKKAKIADKISAKTMRNAYMREYREKKKADESRKGKSHENNPSLECGVKELSVTTNKHQNAECQNELATTTTTSNKETKKDMPLDYFISDFHILVSQGPLFICSCCDQLWYKHSVSSADTIRKSNP